MICFDYFCYMKKNLQYFLFLLGILILLSTSCKRQDKTAPEKPELRTIEVDLSAFEVNMGGTHYNFASSKLNIWQKLLIDSMDFQKSLFNYAITNDQSFQEENIWALNGDVIYNDTLYEVSFITEDFTDSLLYNIYFSLIEYNEETSLVYLNLLTFEGISYYYNQTPNFYGNWKIQKPDTSESIGKSFLEVSWGDTIKAESFIKFTYVSGGNKNGNYIIFQDSIDGLYDSYLDIYSKVEENHTYIQWNNTTKRGRVKDINNFPDDAWRYWDESLENDTVN